MARQFRLAVTLFVLLAVLLMPQMAAANEGAAAAGAAPAGAAATDKAATDKTAADKAAPDSRVATVTVSMRVENRSTDENHNLVVVLPPSVLNLAGTQRVVSVEMVTKPESTRQTPAGLEATYKFADMPVGASVTIEQRYTVELLGAATAVTETKVDPQYLAPEVSIESDNPQIVAKAKALTADLKTADAKAEALVAFVSRHVKYSYKSPARGRGALAAFQAGGGICTEYAKLFVAMSRAAGVPARVVYGWGSPRSLGATLDAFERHAWAEYYSPEKGWVQVDPTFAAGLPLDQVMTFNAYSHVAQDRAQPDTKVAYNGKGYLTVATSYAMTFENVTPAVASR